jgi:hypothetical protein
MAGGPSSACTTLGADTRTGCEHGQGAHRAAVGFGCNDWCVPYRGRTFRYLYSRASNSELNRNLCANGYFLRSGHSRACLHARGDGVCTSALACRQYPRRLGRCAREKSAWLHQSLRDSRRHTPALCRRRSRQSGHVTSRLARDLVGVSQDHAGAGQNAPRDLGGLERHGKLRQTP